jgi:hypothetical protein
MRDIIEILGEAILVATFQHPDRHLSLGRIHHWSIPEPDENERRGRSGPRRSR